LKDSAILETKVFKDQIKEVEEKLKNKGRLSIRKSGTENLLRIMIECEDEALLQAQLNCILSAIPNE
jgi:phosphoglucosamine mutase